MTYFQVLSRNNDINGNPYRLILCYDGDGMVTDVYEARSSQPNICHRLRTISRELPAFHLEPKEYNDTKKRYTATGIKLKYEN